MKILFLDPFSGLSGDMFVGALLDLGVDLARLAHEISKLELGGYHLSSKRVFRGAMSAIKFDVEIGGALQTEFDAEPSAPIEADHGHSHGHDHSHAHPVSPLPPSPSLPRSPSPLPQPRAETFAKSKRSSSTRVSATA